MEEEFVTLDETTSKFYREIRKSFILGLSDILLKQDAIYEIIEASNARDPFFKNIKICKKPVTRFKKQVPCGEDTKSPSGYCNRCIKVVKKNNIKLSIDLSPIANGLYWCQKNDHIYEYVDDRLTLYGKRRGARIDKVVTEKDTLDAIKLQVQVL